MSSGKQGARGSNLLVGRGEDRAEHLDRQLFGKRRDRERQEGRAAHGEHIVESVRRRNRSVVGRVVHDRREEIEREDQGALVVEPVDGGVVRRREPHEQVLSLCRHETREQLLQAGRGILGGAAPAGSEVRQFDCGGVGIQGFSSLRNGEL